MVIIFSFALAGANLGFLKHNFPRAHIFMGDSGSLVIGYILSLIGIMISWKADAATLKLLVPVLVLGYPIFDTSLVFIMRILEKRSIFQGGKDHSSHRLALLGYKKFGAVLIIYLISMLMGIAGIAIYRSGTTTAVSIGVTAFLLMCIFGIRLALVDAGRFGYKKG
jgi:UDP-N-acetylmuramyl pentapeptide phosphotransferase/UDP-N-acetylglucosamine-1-phosphate transferase